MARELKAGIYITYMEGMFDEEKDDPMNKVIYVHVPHDDIDKIQSWCNEFDITVTPISSEVTTTGKESLWKLFGNSEESVTLFRLRWA